MEAVLALFNSVIADIQTQSPANQVTIWITIASPTLIPLIGWIYSSTRAARTKKSIEGLESQIQILRQDVKRAEARADEEENHANFWMPERWITSADQLIKSGDGPAAKHVLTVGLENMFGPLADATRKLLVLHDDGELSQDSQTTFDKLPHLLRLLDSNTIHDGIQFPHRGALCNELAFIEEFLARDNAEATLRQMLRLRHQFIQNCRADDLVWVYRLGVLKAQRSGIAEAAPGFIMKQLLAEALCLCGANEAAFETIDSIIEPMKAVDWGPEPQPLSARILRARILAELGRTTEAVGEIDAVLPKYQSALGASHHDVFAAIWLKGRIYLLDGRVREAVRVLQDLADRLALEKNTNARLAITTNIQLTAALSRNGESSRALELSKRTLPHAKQLFDATDPELLNFINLFERLNSEH